MGIQEKSTGKKQLRRKATHVELSKLLGSKSTWQQMAEENLHNLLIKKLQPQF